MGGSSLTTVRIGTRGSALALWQANWVADQLRDAGHKADITILKTVGDVSTQPLNTMGGVGVFTKEIQRAVLADEVDIAVHSLKDLPTIPTPGLALISVPPRESHHDALVMSHGKNGTGEGIATLNALPEGARIGTGSIRRRSQLLNMRPDLKVGDIRGNVDTRLKKLDAGEFDALILAEAGLRRLGLQDRISEKISVAAMVPAVGQGALGIEARVGDTATHEAIAILDDVATHLAVVAERAMLAELLAGCLAPVGGHATWNDGSMELVSVVLSGDGKQKIEHRQSAACPDHAAAISLGCEVAKTLADQGAAELIATARA